MRNERLRKIVQVPLVLSLLLLLGLVMLDPKRKGDTLEATMNALLVQETNKGTRTQILATLESGRKVVVYGTADFRDGARITLQEYVSRILGRRSYHFVSFEE